MRWCLPIMTPSITPPLLPLGNCTQNMQILCLFSVTPSSFRSGGLREGLIHGLLIWQTIEILFTGSVQQRQIVNHEKFQMQFLLCFVSLVNLCAQEPLQNRAWICNWLSCFCLGIQGPVEHGCTPREARGLWSCRAWRFSVHANEEREGTPN